jgi:dGTPase
MTLTYENFKGLIEKNRLKNKPIETRLFHKLSSKHKATYLASVCTLHEQSELTNADKLHELYYRSRLLIDYISGMTDGFALEEYQNLSASA